MRLNLCILAFASWSLNFYGFLSLNLIKSSGNLYCKHKRSVLIGFIFTERNLSSWLFISSGEMKNFIYFSLLQQNRNLNVNLRLSSLKVAKKKASGRISKWIIHIKIIFIFLRLFQIYVKLTLKLKCRIIKNNISNTPFFT